MLKKIKMISAANFKNYMSKNLKEITPDTEPIYITVNGEGHHVIMHEEVYEELLKYKQDFLVSNGQQVPYFKALEERKTPLRLDEYEALEATHRSLWSLYTAAELEDIKKQLERDGAELEHQNECFAAKFRAYNSLVSKEKEVRFGKEITINLVQGNKESEV